MTRRIVLTLADAVTSESCGKVYTGETCPMLSEEWSLCTVYRRNVERVDGEDLPAIDDWYRRLPECLAAEAAASRLVEIAPDDADTIATIVDDWNRRCIPEADLPESIARIRDVLRDHAGPVR